jgi:hypothetical protein
VFFESDIKTPQEREKRKYRDVYEF